MLTKNGLGKILADFLRTHPVTLLAKEIFTSISGTWGLAKIGQQKIPNFYPFISNTRSMQEKRCTTGSLARFENKNIFILL
jgi:hypothetical protein